jgi:hypothetical protein
VRAALALALTAVLALAATGCGGSDVAYQEVPGPPPQLTVPEGSSALASNSDPASANATATATPAATTDAGTAAPESTAAPAATATATPAPQGESGGTAPSTGENTGGSEFDAFCNENPGACD